MQKKFFFNFSIWKINILQFDKIIKYFGGSNNLLKMKKVNSIIKLSNNSSFGTLICAILEFWNIDYSTFRLSKFWNDDFGTQHTMHRCQNLERWNVKRPIFRNFNIANIKVTKDELFDSFIFEFHFLEIMWTPKIFNNFLSCDINFTNGRIEFCFIFQITEFYKSVNYLGNWLIFQIINFWNLWN